MWYGISMNYWQQSLPDVSSAKSQKKKEKREAALKADESETVPPRMRFLKGFRVPYDLCPLA